MDGTSTTLSPAAPPTQAAPVEVRGANAGSYGPAAAGGHVNHSPIASTPEPDKPSRLRKARLWMQDHGLSAVALLILFVVAICGWWASFIGLHTFAVDRMMFTDRQAWLVPITIDGAACGLTLMVFRAAIQGRSAPLYRLLIVFFTALSSWINWAHIADHTGGRVAAVLCPSAVVLLEAITMEMRHSWEARNGLPRPRIHPLRWVFAPWPTLMIMRRWVMGLPYPKHLQDAQTESDRTALARPTGESESGAGTARSGRPDPTGQTRQSAPSLNGGRVSDSISDSDPTQSGWGGGQTLGSDWPRASLINRQPSLITPQTGDHFQGSAGRLGSGPGDGSGRNWSAPAPIWPEGEEAVWSTLSRRVKVPADLFAEAVGLTRDHIAEKGRFPGRDRLRADLIERDFSVGSENVQNIINLIREGLEILDIQWAERADAQESAQAASNGNGADLTDAR